MPSDVEPLFPLFLRLRHRHVLVVGAGPLGTEKVRDLLAAGAVVTVVAPAPSDDVRTWAAENKLTLHVRPFDAADVTGQQLIVAATGLPAVHAAVFAAAEAQRTFVVALDDPASGSAYFGSILRRPPFLVAISSHGQAPALTRLLREVLEHALPPAHYVQRARELRRRWKAEGTPMASRFPALLRELAHSAANEDDSTRPAGTS